MRIGAAWLPPAGELAAPPGALDDPVGGALYRSHATVARSITTAMSEENVRIIASHLACSGRNVRAKPSASTCEGAQSRSFPNFTDHRKSRDSLGDTHGASGSPKWRP